MCKIWEGKVSLSSAKSKKCNLNKMFNISIGQKHKKIINMRP